MAVGVADDHGLVGLARLQSGQELDGWLAKRAAARPGSPVGSPGTAPGASTASGDTSAGGLGDLLNKSGLGGLLAGGAAGSVLSTGLNDLLKQFQQSGQGEVAQSWVGRGPNQSISPQDLGAALGADHINALAKSRACPAMTCSMGSASNYPMSSIN
jgi:uncharacterized protein YidB (DUF937 family)